MARHAAFPASYDADREQQDQEPQSNRVGHDSALEFEATPLGNLTAEAPASREPRRLATLTEGRLSALSLCAQSSWVTNTVRHSGAACPPATAARSVPRGPHDLRAESLPSHRSNSDIRSI